MREGKEKTSGVEQTNQTKRLPVATAAAKAAATTGTVLDK